VRRYGGIELNEAWKRDLAFCKSIEGAIKAAAQPYESLKSDRHGVPARPSRFRIEEATSISCAFASVDPQQLGTARKKGCCRHGEGVDCGSSLFDFFAYVRHRAHTDQRI
jgi:hypothetical protein